MATVFIRHRVKDYGDWKHGFDENEATRRQWGVTGATVHRDADKRDTIIVTLHFGHVSAARAFAGSDVLQSAMKQAGVVGRPQIWLAEDIERIVYPS